MDPRYAQVTSELLTSRSLVRIPHNYKTTFNAGDLIPICQPIEVLPGDTWKDKVSAVCRELTLAAPPMDNSYLQIDAFFCPLRILWTHTKQFFGENDTSAWTSSQEYEIPANFFNLVTGSNFIESGSIGDYFGLPVNVMGDDYYRINYLPLRAYAMIYNYWYLNQNIQSPILYSIDDNNEFSGEVIRDDSGAAIGYTGLKGGYASKPLKVNRFIDLFTGCLPAPQKGPNVDFLSKYLPVYPKDSDIIGTADLVNEASPLRWTQLGAGTTQTFTQGNGTVLLNGNVNTTAFGNETVTSGETTQVGSNSKSVIPMNLIADTQYTGLSTINALRIAIVTQHYYERLSRFGSRFEESIYALFSIRPSSKTIAIPEYIGGHRQMLNVDQVLATADNANAPLGTTGAFSNTYIDDDGDLFTYSAEEYGYIIILAHIRTDNTYSQGLPKVFSKKTKFDIYNPLFANIGNVPVLNREIYFQDYDIDDEVFGYQEAWYEYRFMPNMTTGYMRPGVENGFANWTYGRVFDELPVLNEQFIQQTADEVDRTIIVQSELTNQFKLDIMHSFTKSSVMPEYSIPGLKSI